MTSEICANSAIDESTRLLDRRDNKKYWVSKLADGNCWMTQSLDLDLQAGVELTPDNTDIDSNWDPGATTFTSGRDGSENDSLVQSWDMGAAIWKTPDSLTNCILLNLSLIFIFLSFLLYKGSITVVVKIDLFVDSTEAQAVSNDKGVHIVILRQVVVIKLELIDLLGIEDMDLLVVRRKRAVFP